ncbi:porin [Verticiella sediminum]|nr:porin [Verticiella sediminum]
MTPLSHLRLLPCITVAFLAAGTAHAQSSVRLYGIIDVYVGSMKTSGGERMSQVNSGGMTTSYFGIAGQEDLGQDLKAIFALEGYLRANTGESGRYPGDTMFSRAAYAGLASERLGTVRLGRIGTPLFTNTLLFNPLGGSFGFSPAIRNIFSPGTLSGDSAWNSAVAYSTPKFGGLSGELIYGTKGTDANGRTNVGGGLSYREGAFSIGVAAQQVKSGFATGEENTWQIGTAYDFGVAKVFLSYTSIREGDTGSLNADTHDKIGQVGLSAPVGPGSVLVSYSRDRVTGAQDYWRDVATVGYDYRLSKRTDLYAMVMRDKISDESQGMSYALGMRHAF